MNGRDRIGAWGEEEAAAYLERHGYTVLHRNYRTRFGEIDIVAERKGWLRMRHPLVFCEVKTIQRHGAHTALAPEENVHARKQKKLIQMAKVYCAQERVAPARPWQIDVIAVEADSAARTTRIRHIEQVVTE